MNTSNGRMKAFDLAKFIAIFAVLWGHVIQYLVSGIYYEDSAYRIIYSFHMPLFMVIVGYFGATSYRKGLYKLGVRKFRQLIIPSITFALITCVIMKYTAWGGVKDVLIFSLWFLKSAFLCYMIYSLAVINKRYSDFLLTVSLIASQFIYYSQFNLMYPCFLYGVVLNRYWDQLRVRARTLAIWSGLLFLIMLIPWDERFWIIPTGGTYPLSGTDQLLAFAPQFYYRLFIGLIGSLFLIMSCEYICSKYGSTKPIAALSSIGQHTMGIYLLQTVIIELMLWRWFNFDDVDIRIFQFLVAPLISAMVMMVCLAGIKIIRKSHILSLLLLGESK